MGPANRVSVKRPDFHNKGSRQWEQRRRCTAVEWRANFNRQDVCENCLLLLLLHWLATHQEHFSKFYSIDVPIKNFRRKKKKRNGCSFYSNTLRIQWARNGCHLCCHQPSEEKYNPNPEAHQWQSIIGTRWLTHLLKLLTKIVEGQVAIHHWNPLTNVVEASRKFIRKNWKRRGLPRSESVSKLMSIAKGIAIMSI